MTTRARAIPRVIAIAGALHFAAFARGPSDADWIELRTDTGTVVVSDAGENAARDLLDRIEKVRALVELALGNAVRPDDEPLIVLAPRNIDGMREIVGDAAKRNRGLLVAASLPAPYSHHLAVRAGARQTEQQQLLLHEYIHHVTHVKLDEPPAWLDEGLSEFWSTLALADNRARVGAPIARHLRTLRSGRLMPLGELVKVRRGRYDTVKGNLALFYAQSWALVHLLMADQRTVPHAYAPALPDDLAALHARLVAYIRAGTFEPFEIPIDMSMTGAAPGAPKVRTITTAESLALRASVMVYGEHPESALRLANRALQLNPAEALALEAKGIYFFLSNQPDAAKEWLRKAVESPVASFRAHYYYGVAMAGTPQVAERHLRRAIELKPGFPAALERLRPRNEI